MAHSRDISLQDPTPSPKPNSIFTNSDTLVQDPEKEKRHTAIVEEFTTEEIIVEEKVHPPSLGHPPKEIPQDNLQTNPSSTKDVEVAGDNDYMSLEDDDKEVEILSLPVYESRFGMLPSWLTDLFGRRNKFFRDWESQTLEAFFVHKSSPVLLKLPFGHQRLTFGLKRLMKKNKGLSWDQYISLDPQHHQQLNRAVINAKQLDSRGRTFLAIEVHKKKPCLDAERMLVFFSLGAPVEPVHLTDCVGRKFCFPFERCRTWKVSFQNPLAIRMCILGR